MSTTRSFSTGRPLIGSTVIGLAGLRSLSSVLQASRLRPLIRMASEPQTPWAQERRKVSEPSMFPLDLVQGVEHPVGAVHGDLEVLPGGVLGDLGVVAADPQGDVEGRDVPAASDVRGQFDLGGWLSKFGGHQYFRSIGW